MATLNNNKLSMRIATYNIAGASYDKDLSNIAADILNCGADIVGIQEVDILAHRSGNVDQLKVLLEKTGFGYGIFVYTLDLIKGGQYGTAIISKYPILENETIPLDSPAVEPRSVGRTVIDVCGKKINYFNTHLAYENTKAIVYHMEQLAKIVGKCDSYICTADYNTNNFGLFNVLPGHKLANNAEHELVSLTGSGAGIDNIVMTNDFDYANVNLGPEGHSDHQMLWADVTKQF